jgi:hypothetical protein
VIRTKGHVPVSNVARMARCEAMVVDRMVSRPSNLVDWEIVQPDTKNMEGKNEESQHG